MSIGHQNKWLTCVSIFSNMPFQLKFWNRPFFKEPANARWVYVAACVLVSLKIMFLETCDNFDCFQASHFHLVKHLDLYLMYPAEHHTEYNYSPFFAWLMGAFAYLPGKLGILVWNLFNLFPFLLAVRWLPLDKTQQNFLYWFCLIEYITAAENVQTNATVAACIMLVLVYQQAGSTLRASFFLVAGAFFKIYVLTAGVFFLLYPRKGWFTLQALGWGVLFFAAPLTVVSLDQLLFLYSSWFQRLQLQTVRDSLSLTGIVERGQIPGLGQGVVVLLGLLSVLLPLLNKEIYHHRKKQLQYLALVLLFTVVFNPGVESPSYIIALPGVALWYTLGGKTKWALGLLVLVFVFTCLSPTEVFPKFVRDQYLKPYHIKAIPVILVYVVAWWPLVSFRWRTQQPSKSASTQMA